MKIDIIQLYVILGDPTCYETFLKSRPDSMEIDAIKNIIELSEKYK